MTRAHQDNQLASRILKSGARAYAAYAATELMKTRPVSARKRDQAIFTALQADLVTRIEELAAAVAADQVDLFTCQLHWACEAARTHGGCEERFLAGLIALRSVLATELPSSIRPVVVHYLDQAIDGLARSPVCDSTRLLPETRHARLALTYLLAILEGDRSRASRVILDAIDGPETIRDIYLKVLMPAQAELGQMWLKGEINVAEEHFGSYTTRMVMSQILSLATCEPRNGKTVLTAAVAGNHVDIGLHAVADFFEMAGWQTIRLGADVPTRDLVESIGCFHVDLLALSASQTVQIETVKSAIEAVRAESQGQHPKILVGGLAFATSTELAMQIGADGYAADPEGAVELGSQLVGLRQTDEIDVTISEGTRRRA